jgi:hypothetical protein
MIIHVRAVMGYVCITMDRSVKTTYIVFTQHTLLCLHNGTDGEVCLYVQRNATVQFFYDRLHRKLVYDDVCLLKNN